VIPLIVVWPLVKPLLHLQWGPTRPDQPAGTETELSVLRVCGSQSLKAGDAGLITWKALVKHGHQYANLDVRCTDCAPAPAVAGRLEGRW
jgi:hypothetical protein